MSDVLQRLETRLFETRERPLLEPVDDLVLAALRISSISAAQLVTFVGCYEAVVETYQSRFGQMNHIYGFGMQMDHGLYLLAILAGAQALGHTLFNRFLHRLFVTVVCNFVWINYWTNISEVVPNRFGLLAFLGGISFLVGTVLNTRRVSSDLR